VGQYSGWSGLTFRYAAFLTLPYTATILYTGRWR
jgi:hypothetical protein